MHYTYLNVSCMEEKGFEPLKSSLTGVSLVLKTSALGQARLLSQATGEI
jgi:hypothetical protein